MAEPFYFDEDAELGDYYLDDEESGIGGEGIGGQSKRIIVNDDDELEAMMFMAAAEEDRKRVAESPNNDTNGMGNSNNSNTNSKLIHRNDADIVPMDRTTNDQLTTTVTTTLEEDVSNSDEANFTASAAAVTPLLPAATAISGNDDAEVTIDSVEEFLASRNRENDLFHFERYKKGADWRSSLTSTTATQVSSSNATQVKRTWSSKTKSAVPAAADAQFLSLLHWRNSTKQNKMYSVSSSSSSLYQKSKHSQGFWKMPILGIDTLPITLGDGQQVFVRRSRGVVDDDSTNNNNRSSSSSRNTTGESYKTSCSLGVTMTELQRRVNNMRRNSIRAQSTINSESTPQFSSTSSLGRVGRGALWVDKHAPSSFAQLLSDERTNREVLRALRGWDPYVFGRQQPMRPQTDYYNNAKDNGSGRHQQQQLNQRQPSVDNKADKENTAIRNPNDKRPPENCRVIMLSGPPGVGKTTLAHIVARHAGYRPLEVNASDDRSASVLTERIQRAMESATLNKASSSKNHHDHGKPNCLILDEIDGADAKGAIQALADMIQADIPQTKNSKTRKSKSGVIPYLRRPIICICNHKYAPELRPLLPYAMHFNVDPPSSARLVARLKTILIKEKVSMMAGGSLLHQLVVSTGGDIRSCLFTLQFAAAENSPHQDLSQSLMNSLNGTGLKDDRNDAASTITTIFRKVKSKSLDTTASMSKFTPQWRKTTGEDHNLNRVMNAVEGFADDTTTLNAMFLNVLGVSYIDPALDRCSAAHELLSWADLNPNNGRYSTHRVPTPPVAAGIHLLCRVEIKPKLTFSTRELGDVHYQQEANQALIQKFVEGLPVKASKWKCRDCDLLCTEFIPMLLWILSAGEGVASLSRPSSSMDLLTKTEREVADYHVAILSALGLTYIPDQERMMDLVSGTTSTTFRQDAAQMKLEPPIHRLVHYRGLLWSHQQMRKEIPTNMKVLLAHQVRLESFRRQERADDDDVMTDKDGDKSYRIVTEEKTDPSEDTTAANISKGTPRKLDRLDLSTTGPEAKRVKGSPTINAGNFLGIAAKKGKESKSARRAAALGLLSSSSGSISPSSSKQRKLCHTGSGFPLHQVVRMKYVKGFTQAVRTPCRLQDLE